jgi:UDP:flavonoid glycosyltransferase YjiC (YdhE family)
MKVLFTTQPSSGHWHPLVPLAQELEKVGHEVAFVSTPGFCPVIEVKGFRCFRAGADDNEEEIQQIREQRVGPTGQPPPFSYLKYVFAGIRAERSLPDLLDIIDDWRPDVVVRDNLEFAGCIAAEHAGIPHATLQVMAAWPQWLQALEEPLDQLRASVGLPPMKPADVLFRYLLLFPRPPSLWNPAFPVQPTTHTFKYAGFNQSGEEQLPGWVANLGRQRPTVYATMGTLFNHRTEILSAILDGLREEPIELILTVGRNRDPSEFGEQPAHVHVERYIPQNLLLPHCDLVISHGGSGTIMDALSLGLPMVIIPILADQPENAQRCAEAGVARVIEPEQRTAQAIRDAAREVLGDARYRRNAERLRKEIEALPGLEYPVALLERLAAERIPLIAETPIE